MLPTDKANPITSLQATMNPAKGLFTALLKFLFLQICISRDTMHVNESITDVHGNVLVSKGEKFTLGFFSPANSTDRYVGIWYTKVSVQTVVWVANRNDPITDTSGVLSISNQGGLILRNKYREVPVWSANATVSSPNNCIAQILDTGNFVLVQQDSNTVVWKSFDYPTNVMLPFTKLGLDRRTGLKWLLTSWKSPNDPRVGNWSYWLEPNGAPQAILYNGQVRRWRSGPFDGVRWNGMPDLPRSIINTGTFVYNSNETSAGWGSLNYSIITILIVDESGFIKRYTWNDKDSRWIQFWTVPKESCDNYGHCGINGNCDPYTPGIFECTCLPGFEPNLPDDWELRDGSGGCVRKSGALTCQAGEGFVRVANAKVPDTSQVHVDMSIDLKACKEECLRNCSCTAYSSAEVNRRGGCMIWYGDLNDTRVYVEGGQDLYIRVDALELAKYEKSKAFLAKKGMLAILVTSLAVIVILFIATVFWLVKRKRNGRKPELQTDINSLTSFQDCPGEPELQIFDQNTIIAATENFSLANKLGRGGFGSVYKGRLANGQEIAVKRLSNTSGQGVKEFKNEVMLISKLQHKNLVRLFGCSFYKEEKMLIYEYLPNKSLDLFIFDNTRRLLLDWAKRFEIILGIARGLLYLHQDSRLKIIHRDLKAANVLLDAVLNPKISDFGMARIFGEDQTEANTNKVVGTYGYISPEYAMEGQYSTKSDVFSFGVLTLEIISGRKNNNYYYESSSPNLVAHVWDLWIEGRALEIVDSSLEESYRPHEVLRCIQIGLLCVQECPADRPTMLSNVFMLGNDTTLPSPNKPAFILRRRHCGTDSSTTRADSSVNDASITEFEGR